MGRDKLQVAPQVGGMVSDTLLGDAALPPAISLQETATHAAAIMWHGHQQGC
jgi:hypothetical protein